MLAQWVMSGEQPLDLWSVDIRRFSGLHADRAWTRARTLEAYGKHYAIAFPLEEYESGRPRIVSPLYERLKARRAVFGSKLGWERANWFAPVGVDARDVHSFGRGNWFAAVGEEHRAARERVALFDQSSFAKFEMTGKGAAEALSWIAANDVTRPPGRLTYTQMLNSRGGIECDLTVARLAGNRFYIVTGTGFRTHDFAWIRQNIPAGLDAALTDVTEAFGTLSLMGPRSRDVLSAVSDADLSNAAFPFGAVREIAVAGVPVRALRVTYVGELGWELHMPIADTGAVFDALMAAGAPHGIAPAGYRAIESLRLEKGYRVLGRGHHPQRHAVRGRPRLGGQAEVGDAVPRPRGAGEDRRRQSAQEDPRRPSRSAIRRSSCRAAKPSSATASRSAICRAAAGATRSAPVLASAMSAIRLASTMRSSAPAATSWKSPRNACRRRSTCGRSTIRPAFA